MKRKLFVLTILVCAIFLAAGATAWGIKGGIPANDKKPPPGDEEPPPNPVDGFWYWRWGHMDGPHDSSKALGISRDGKTAVGSTVVVDFTRAWRLDIDWAIATDDGVPPLYNELQVQEDVGVVAPSQPSAAYAASDMDVDENGVTIPCSSYDKEALQLDWCGSKPVGGYQVGMVSYGIEWLLPVLDRVDEPFEAGIDFWAIPDFGGGISDMQIKDVSADGVILVGTGNAKTGPKAFRADTTVLDEDGVPVAVQLTIQDMVTLQTLQSSTAQAVSADGTIIAGYGATKIANRAFVSTFLGMDDSTGEAILESYILPMLGGGKFAEAYALTVTDEGVIYIAGRCDSPKGPVACIWFRDETQTDAPWVIKELGALSKKNKDAVATSIAYRPGSAVGELIVVGRSQTNLYPSEAFVWTGNPVLEPDGEGDEYIGYFYDLEYILIKTGAGEASLMGSSWILYEATGISAAGDRIVGWGINPEGGVEAWLVTEFPYDELDLTHEE